MKIKVGTFNLFQFVKPPYSYYEKKDRFTKEQWSKKTSWIKAQILKMNCDIIGFQEVFSQDELRDLTYDLGFKYFKTVDMPKSHFEDELIYITTTVAIASKYPIENIHEVKPHKKSLKKHKFTKQFRFSRIPIKADIRLKKDLVTTFYVCHLKSNRENEFEYIFTKDTSLDEKKRCIKKALELNFSES
ncbi:MAG: endonuclease/exonuclease/phosphatase family protein, partial [Campylobacterota bacterium]